MTYAASGSQAFTIERRWYVWKGLFQDQQKANHTVRAADVSWAIWKYCTLFALLLQLPCNSWRKLCNMLCNIRQIWTQAARHTNNYCTTCPQTTILCHYSNSLSAMTHTCQMNHKHCRFCTSSSSPNTHSLDFTSMRISNSLSMTLTSGLQFG